MNLQHPILTSFEDLLIFKESPEETPFLICTLLFCPLKIWRTRWRDERFCEAFALYISIKYWIIYEIWRKASFLSWSHVILWGKAKVHFEVRYQICFDTKVTFWEAQQSLLKTLTLVESTMPPMLTLPTAGLQPWWRTHNSDTWKAYLYLYSKNGVLWTMVSAHTFSFHV